MSVQGSVALANLDFYIKTAHRQPLYGLGRLMKILKQTIFAIHNEYNLIITTQKASKLFYMYSC